MILTINIGNSNITVGGYENDRLTFSAQLYSDMNCSVDEYAIKLDALLDLYNVFKENIQGAILSSVVPLLTGRISDALRQLFQVRVLLVGPGLKSGLPIRIDNPSELGGELLCCAVAGMQITKPPFVVIHMDTAISMMAVNRQGQLVGGVIVPGPLLALRSLVSRTAQLPQVNLRKKPTGVLATNTADSLQNGIILGNAAMIDGLLEQFKAELGEDTRYIATGSLPTTIIRTCKSSLEYKENLLLDGLYAIWQKNAK